MSNLPEALTKAKVAAEVLSALLNRIEELRQETLGAMRQAKKEGDSRILLAAIGRMEGQLSLVAEMAGQLRSKDEADAMDWPTDIRKPTNRQLAKLGAWLEQMVSEPADN
jgi:hypothetical protein